MDLLDRILQSPIVLPILINLQLITSHYIILARWTLDTIIVIHILILTIIHIGITIILYVLYILQYHLIRLLLLHILQIAWILLIQLLNAIMIIGILSPLIQYV